MMHYKQLSAERQQKLSDTCLSALADYRRRHSGTGFRAVLFDMDGILYDSMPRHARAWMKMCADVGLEATEEEFFASEGRTGADTIRILAARNGWPEPADDEIKRLYGLKSKYFAEGDEAPVMDGAQLAVSTVLELGGRPVLVTGSGQGSLLGRLDTDYPGAFPHERRVTAYDVTHGKPHPEPFLKGAAKGGVDICNAIGVDNAPLGVQSASAAGVFTIGVRTGPLAEGTLMAAGADIEVSSMTECAFLLARLLQ